MPHSAGEDYSVSSRHNEIGQVTEVSSAAGTIVYQYDERGNLLSVTNHNGDVVSYSYDQYGNKTSISITNDDGQIVVLHDVFFSMEGKDNDLTHVPFEEYYKMHKNDIFWGDQLY